MKINFFIIIFGLFLSFAGDVQSQSTYSAIGITENWSFIGRNWEFSYEKGFDRNFFKFGLHLFQNGTALENNYYYKNNFRAYDFTQFWGYSLAFQRTISIPDSHIEAGPFMRFRYFSLGLRRIVDRHTYEEEQPLPTFDYTIGIKGKVKLWKDISLTGGAEGGLLLIKNPAPGLDNVNGLDWELSHNFFIGLNYRL